MENVQLMVFACILRICTTFLFQSVTLEVVDLVYEHAFLKRIRSFDHQR
ncbi:hypothetical protein APHWI1_0614 [Anaplasma phagocytophilum str. ApWI1]|uniref:Uncharacterized protein n=1 Tax=Anaplasma phagocytophilum str. ApWI1 TaxID=1359155 RepID=A0A0F3PW79_ANAPH|nr:hypothetical protein APHWI1_0614 [Anaplasma phagocytophilum str. ApWI1]KJV87044.1 hypothetical protein APHNYW_1126 [Anaplasma phagocytophilum str. ApNYW]KJV98197.1 hypothetical protein OTSANNIE_1385 [Anaplasma phagocytophilum str. Annie]KJZ99138.1 hypothetical protein APHCR_0592 [Anaplasma phagocytophilum str. CR1007]